MRVFKEPRWAWFVDRGRHFVIVAASPFYAWRDRDWPAWKWRVRWDWSGIPD